MAMRGVRIVPALSRALLACLLLSGLAGGASAVQKDGPSHAVGKRAMRDGDYQKAVQVFLDLMAADPGDINAHVGASQAYYKLQDYKLSFDEATAALKLDENNAKARALSGIALLRSGYLEHAVADLLQALRVNPKE